MCKNKKDFGKLTDKQLKRIFAQLHQATIDISTFQTDIEEGNYGLQDVVELAGQGWASFYELPYTTFLAIFSICFGLDKKLAEFAQSEDPQEATLIWSENDFEGIEDRIEYSDEEKSLLLCLVLAQIKNIQSIQRYHMSINDLLVRSDGQDEYLLDAILIDKHVLNTPTAQARIARAEIENDGAFFDFLSKAIKGKLSKPNKKYDYLRYILTVIDEAKGLSNLTYEKISDTVDERLELFPTNNKDPVEALKKFIQRRKKYIGT